LLPPVKVSDYVGIIEAGRDAGAANKLAGSHEIQGFIRRDSLHKKFNSPGSGSL
jgi:hypothetical protein